MQNTNSCVGHAKSFQENTLRAFFQKLDRRFVLSETDRNALEGVGISARRIDPRKSFILEDDSFGYVHIIRNGLACQYRMLPDGRRCIVALYVPGDICDLASPIPSNQSYGVRTLSACEVVRVRRNALNDVKKSRSTIRHALEWMSLIDTAILSEWLVSSRCRTAEQQIAHLFCEWLVRLRTVNLVVDDSYHLPITQGDLSDITGLSNVHVNRVIQKLRSEKLIVLREKRLRILSVKALMKIADFEPNYLNPEPMRLL